MGHCHAPHICAPLSWFRGKLFPTYWALSPALREKLQHFSVETTPRSLAPNQSAQFTKHLVPQRLQTACIKEALLPFNFPMIVTLFLAPQSFLRSLNHFLDSLEPKVASQRRPRLCDLQEPGHTSWLYLFLWEISRSLNLALADPRRAAITVRIAPCNYKHHLLFISGQNENACEYDGPLYAGRYHDCTVNRGLISFPIKSQ